MSDIGMRIINILKEQGKTQKELAKAIGTGTSTVSNWKAGKDPSSEFIVPICGFLNVSCEYLLTGQESPSGTVLSDDELEIIGAYRSMPPNTKEELRREMRWYIRGIRDTTVTSEPVAAGKPKQIRQAK